MSTFGYADLGWVSVAESPQWPCRRADLIEVDVSLRRQGRSGMFLVYFFGVQSFAWVHKKSVQLWNADVDVPEQKRPLLQKIALEEAYEWQKDVFTKPPTRRRNPESSKPKYDARQAEAIKSEKVAFVQALKSMYKAQVKELKRERRNQGSGHPSDANDDEAGDSGSSDSSNDEHDEEEQNGIGEEEPMDESEENSIKSSHSANSALRGRKKSTPAKTPSKSRGGSRVGRGGSRGGSSNKLTGSRANSRSANSSMYVDDESYDQENGHGEDGDDEHDTVGDRAEDQDDFEDLDERSSSMMDKEKDDEDEEGEVDGSSEHREGRGRGGGSGDATSGALRGAKSSTSREDGGSASLSHQQQSPSQQSDLAVGGIAGGAANASADELTEIDLSSAIQRGKFILRARRNETPPPKKRKYTRRVPLGGAASNAANNATTANANHSAVSHDEDEDEDDVEDDDATEGESTSAMTQSRNHNSKHHHSSSRRSTASAANKASPSGNKHSSSNRVSSRLKEMNHRTPGRGEHHGISTSSAVFEASTPTSPSPSSSSHRHHHHTQASSMLGEHELEELRMTNTIAARRKLRKSGQHSELFSDEDLVTLPLPTRTRHHHHNNHSSERAGGPQASSSRNQARAGEAMEISEDSNKTSSQQLEPGDHLAADSTVMASSTSQPASSSMMEVDGGDDADALLPSSSTNANTAADLPVPSSSGTATPVSPAAPASKKTGRGKYIRRGKGGLLGDSGATPGAAAGGDLSSSITPAAAVPSSSSSPMQQGAVGLGGGASSASSSLLPADRPSVLCSSCILAKPSFSRQPFGLFLFYLLEDQISSQRQGIPRYRCTSPHCSLSFYTDFELKAHSRLHFQTTLRSLYPSYSSSTDLPPAKKAKLSETDVAAAEADEDVDDDNDEEQQKQQQDKKDNDKANEQEKSALAEKILSNSMMMDVDGGDPLQLPNSVDQQQDLPSSSTMDVEETETQQAKQQKKKKKRKRDEKKKKMMKNGKEKGENANAPSRSSSGAAFQCSFPSCLDDDDDDDAVSTSFGSEEELRAHVAKVHCGGLERKSCSRCGLKFIFSNTVPNAPRVGRYASRTAASPATNCTHGRGRKIPFEPMQGLEAPSMIPLPLFNLSYQPPPPPPAGPLMIPSPVTIHTPIPQLQSPSQQQAQQHLHQTPQFTPSTPSSAAPSMQAQTGGSRNSQSPPSQLVYPTAASSGAAVGGITSHHASTGHFTDAMTRGGFPAMPGILPGTDTALLSSATAMFQIPSASISSSSSSSTNGPAASSSSTEEDDISKRRTRLRRTSAAAAPSKMQFATGISPHRSEAAAHHHPPHHQASSVPSSSSTAKSTTKAAASKGSTATSASSSSSSAATALFTAPLPAPTATKGKKGSKSASSSSRNSPAPVLPLPLVPVASQSAQGGGRTSAQILTSNASPPQQQKAGQEPSPSDMGAFFDLINLCTSMVE